MFFNSVDFAIFLPIVFLLHWFVFNKSIKLQNRFLLIASYFFYGWWDWRFLSLILLSSFADYFIGLFLSTTRNLKKRKLLLISSIFLNLGLLVFFKYYNFFLESFIETFSFFGHSINPQGLNIILPVGISFYTFQTLSYSIDIYRKKIKPTKDIVAFFAFVSFFPQLVAGPIERASNLLPQFSKIKQFDYDLATDGMRQVLWGLVKKIVIADNCAIYVNDIFANSADYSGSTLFLGAILFSFQIYGDFSGYSDIAIGTSKLLGFKLTRNFAYPYFSRDIAEFWRRWHISLSSWFKDYVYIPLGGSKTSLFKTIRNVFIVFLLSGLWHGAKWNYVVWGLIHALYFLPLLLLKRNRNNLDDITKGNSLPNLTLVLQIGTTFLATTLAWVFFRATDISHALTYLNTLFSISLFSFPEVFPKKILLLILVFIVIEWMQRNKQHPLQEIAPAIPTIIRWFIYYGLVMLIVIFHQGAQEFIYFKF